MKLVTIDREKILKKFTDNTYGSVVGVNEKLFKFTGGAVPLYIKKVRLADLFAGVPQSVVGVEFGDVVTDMPPEAPSIVSEGFPDSVVASDTLGVHFTNWKRLVGLYDLPREEVDLGQDGDYLVVDARKATLYTGYVIIKIQ